MISLSTFIDIVSAGRGQLHHAVSTSPRKFSDCGNCLIRLDWETLASEVTIRHFSANNYVNDKDPSAVWNGMGNNITCTIDPTTLAPTLSLPSSFDPGC